ncbi:MAG: LacI family DNA-binding transcriptional regulator [Salinarimonas sp.]|nr:LacI family DNA-binding transcriptional regulator [Salinarimonas sp.]
MSDPDISSPPTARDVAKRAGVSVITVSRVMRSAPNVSPAMRDKVRAAALELGYRPNRVAGALRARETGLVAVIVPSMSHSVFPEVIDGIDHGLSGTSLRTVLGITHYDQAREAAILHDLIAWNPAAVIISGLEHHPDVHAMLAGASCPVVEVMDVDGDPIDLCVGTSQQEAGELMAAHLVETGRRRIGYVGAWGERPDRSRKRREAFAAALTRRGLDLAVHIEDAPSSLKTGRAGCAAILAEHPDLDAIHFANDDLALGALFHCRENGIRVPEDIGLAGFNGIELVGMITPRLTTIANPRFEMGICAARMLSRRLNSEYSEGDQDAQVSLPAGDTWHLPLHLSKGDTT